MRPTLTSLLFALQIFLGFSAGAQQNTKNIVSSSGKHVTIHEELQNFITPIYVTGTIDSAYADTAAGLAWIVVNGVATSYAFNPPDYPIIIRDDSGMQYTINPNGTVTVTSYLQYSNDHLDVGALGAIVFQQNNNETFGFDAKEHSAWVEQYELIRLTDSTNYFVANKSIGVDTFDVVDFTFNDSLWDATDFTYQLNGALITPSTVVSGNKITLTLPAIANSGKGKLYVMAGQLKVGKLNLQVYTKKTKKVVIVPLTNSPPNISAIATELKATLGEANLSVEVILKPQWNDVVFTASKAISLPTEVGLMNKYSDDMRDLREAYFEANVANLVEGAYYIFVVPSFSDNTVDGYMVRGKALGFVAASASASTYAHELGHGIGGLNHTWKENGPAEGATSNLMDYNGGNELTLDQWKELRDKDVIPSFWDEAEDNQLSFDEQIKFYNNQKTWRSISSLESKMGITLLNGEIYKFKSSDNISQIIFDKYGRVFSFIKGADTLEAFLGRGDVSGDYFLLGYLKLSDYRENQVKYKKNSTITPAQWTFIQNRKYKFDGCDINQSVLRYSVPFVHNGATNSAEFQIWEKDCYVKEIFQKTSANLINANTLNLQQASALHIGPSFVSNNFTPIENASNDCVLPAELSQLNMNGCAAGIFFELEDKVTNKTDLALLANYLSTLGNNFKYIFYDEPTNQYQYFGKDANSTQNNTSLLVEAFERDATFSISSFKSKYARNKWFYARGFDSVISAVNIRSDIPTGYNSYSLDYSSFETPHVKNWDPSTSAPLLEIINYIDDLFQVQKQQNPSETTGSQYTKLATFIQNVRTNPSAEMANKLKLRFNIIACLDLLGVYDRYEYDLSDLVMRQKSSFKYQIQQKENAGKAVPLTLLNDYNQYVNKYDTECAFFLGMEYMAMYAETIFEPIVVANAIGKIQKLAKTYKTFKGPKGSIDDLLKKNSAGVSGVGNLASHVDIQASLSTIANLKSTNKLTKAIGSASDVELAAIHKYTENGGILNNPMRNGSETVIGPVTFTEFQSQVYQSIKSGLTKLRQTNRLVTSTVIRGRTYSLADFNTLFASSSANVPLKGLVSCTRNEAVAIDFLTKSGASVSGSKVKVIMKIKSKNGVDIDDMSDWGTNLVNQRHPGNLVQEEVLLEEGMFKMIGQPVLIKTEGGIPWYEVNLEELGTALRTIN